MTLLDTPRRRMPEVAVLPTDGSGVYELAVTLRGRPVPGEVDVATYERWALAHRVDSEYVGGKVYLMAPAADGHDDNTTDLTVLIKTFVNRRRLGRVRTDKWLILPGTDDRRLPDLMFIAAANPGRLVGARFFGVPELVVEVVSDDSQVRDWRTKFDLYEAAGVGEYLITDPAAQTMHLFRLGEDGAYDEVPAGEDGRLTFESVPGFWLERGWLFGDDGPDLKAALDVLIGG